MSCHGGQEQQFITFSRKRSYDDSSGPKVPPVGPWRYELRVGEFELSVAPQWRYRNLRSLRPYCYKRKWLLEVWWLFGEFMVWHDGKGIFPKYEHGDWPDGAGWDKKSQQFYRKVK